MHIQEACETLADRFDHWREFSRAVLGANIPEDTQQLAEDLLEWFNTNRPEEEDLLRLYALVEQGRFRAWTCPTCEDRVFEGHPEDWGHFQGAAQQDRTSFPGLGPGDTRCDYCRCHDIRRKLPRMET